MVRDKLLKHTQKRQTQAWEKDEEELQLEQSLFGQRKKRKIAVKKGDEVNGDDQVDIGMRDAEDQDVSLEHTYQL
jgi:U3 small nucleolar RNA-associated protein 18